MFDIEARIAVPESGGHNAVVADVDPAARAVLVDHLQLRGFAVWEADSGIAALALIGHHAPAIALLGQRMSDGERAVALSAMLYPFTRVIITTTDRPLALLCLEDDSPFIRLGYPVDLAALDRCLGALRLMPA